MDVILSDLLRSEETLVLGKAEREECLKILEGSLQSDTKNYHDYFSSQPCSGSIVEDIAEIDAQISLVERRLRNQLVEKKDVILTNLLCDNDNSKIKDIHKELEQLWEIDNESSDFKESTNSELTVDDFLDNDKQTEKKQDDQFHAAVKKLKERSLRGSDSHDFSGNLATVLEDLNNITDLMELPFLARTCIRTGHYQEALMLYTYSKSLSLNFPNSSIIQGVCANVSQETTTTMLSGLVKLLSTNVTVISLKKVLNYLVSIPPFDSANKDLLLRVYLNMRFEFIRNQLDCFSLKTNANNDSLIEMMVKRKIDVLREHIHMSISVFVDTVSVETELLIIPLQQAISQESYEKSSPSNLFILEFICRCLDSLFGDLADANLKGKLKESVCLQLVYCSFRLRDLNFNYHSSFLNKIYESDMFTVEALTNAIQKRRELQFKYSQ